MGSVEEQYLLLLKEILAVGIKKQDRTGTGTLSLFGKQIRHKMSDGFPLITTKKMYFKGVVTELLWFLRGDTNIKYLVNNGCNIWNGDAYKSYTDKFAGNPDIPSIDWFINEIKINDEFAKKWGELGPIYGHQWRRWKGDTWLEGNTDGTDGVYLQSDHIDQITNLINELKINPDSRRLVVSAWNCSEIDQMTLPPCHYGFQIYTRELNRLERIQLGLKAGWKPQDYIENFEHRDLDKWNIPTRAISLMYNCRSQDVPLGTPFNLASYGLLLEIIAKQVNMIPDELIANLGDVHIYLNQIEGIKEQLTRNPYPLPKLKIEDVQFDITSELSDIPSIDSFELIDYKYHSTIKMPLSN